MTPLTIGAIIAAAALLSLGVMAWLAFTAPWGWETDGYHDGEPDEHADPSNFGER
ncbi:MAG: hypothetical protein ACRCYS_13075 [Beijerinckiaceae bacterium]